MLLLPRSVQNIFVLAAKENPRYAVTGVRVTELPDNKFRLDATDGRVAGVIRGSADDPEKYPKLAALERAPNGATSAIIPTDEWNKAFRSAPTKAGFKPILKNVAVVMGQTVATLATTDMSRDSVTSARCVDGRFPNIDEVFPKKSAFRISVDPRYLIRLLNAASAVCDPEAQKVTLEFVNDETPFVVRAVNPNGLRFDGCIMPLTPPTTKSDKPHHIGPPEADKPAKSPRAPRENLPAESEAAQEASAELNAGLARASYDKAVESNGAAPCDPQPEGDDIQDDNPAPDGWQSVGTDTEEPDAHDWIPRGGQYH